MKPGAARRLAELRKPFAYKVLWQRHGRGRDRGTRKKPGTRVLETQAGAVEGMLSDRELTVLRFHNREALELFARITKLRDLSEATKEIADRALSEAQKVAREMAVEVSRREALRRDL